MQIEGLVRGQWVSIAKTLQVNQSPQVTITGDCNEMLSEVRFIFEKSRNSLTIHVSRIIMHSWSPNRSNFNSILQPWSGYLNDGLSSGIEEPGNIICFYKLAGALLTAKSLGVSDIFPECLFTYLFSQESAECNALWQQVIEGLCTHDHPFQSNIVSLLLNMLAVGGREAKLHQFASVFLERLKSNSDISIFSPNTAQLWLNVMQQREQIRSRIIATLTSVAEIGDVFKSTIDSCSRGVSKEHYFVYGQIIAFVDSLSQDTLSIDAYLPQLSSNTVMLAYVVGGVASESHSLLEKISLLSAIEENLASSLHHSFTDWAEFIFVMQHLPFTHVMIDSYLLVHLQLTHHLGVVVAVG